MKIECIALDMDRTTLNSEGSLSPKNRAAIEAAIESGIKVIIASGRAFATLPQEVAQIKGIEYAITSNGAAVYHLPTGKCIKHFNLPSKSVAQIIDATKAEQVAYEVFIDGEVYTDQRFIEHPEHYGLDQSAVDFFEDIRRVKPDIMSFIDERSSDISTLNMYVGDAQLKQRVWQEVDAAAEGVYITTSFQQLIEVLSQEAGKDAGLKFMMDYLGIDKERTAAFGDADNDLEMLSYVGYGVAMANASERCKAAAKYQTIHHDEDGVAYGFREILGLDI